MYKVNLAGPTRSALMYVMVQLKPNPYTLSWYKNFTNYTRSISHHIMPLVINALGGQADIHRHAHTNAQTHTHACMHTCRHKHTHTDIMDKNDYKQTWHAWSKNACGLQGNAINCNLFHFTKPHRYKLYYCYVLVYWLIAYY